jgi:HEAT repeat protein
MGMVGCFNDPSDPKTWIKQLDDVRDGKEAVRQLVKLKDPIAVEPLIAVFKKSHDPEQLKAIATFKDPRSVPIMIDSLDYSEDSFDTASIAATALGEIGDKSAVDGLIKAVQKPLPVKTRANIVKLESMKALAKIKDPKAVDALVKVLSTSADDQDFFLNKVAAKSLGGFADPKAVPALVRGLFMTGRGANIFQECRTALIAIGDPAIDPLVAAMQRKNEDLELDAKKYEFIPGIIVQKSTIVLGDLKAKKAVPALLDELAKKDEGLAAGEGKGISGHQSLILALGLIGDPAAEKPLLAVLNDPKRHTKERAAAAEALNALGDPGALPSLLKAAQGKFISGTTVDPEAGAVVASAVTAYSRLGGAEAANVTFQKVPDEIADMAEAFKAATTRLAVAKECNKDVACYAKYIKDKDSFKAEKAALMLGRLGKPGLTELTKSVATDDPSVRMTVLFGIGHFGDKSCAECTKALEDQIAADESKPPRKQLVDEMRAVRAMLMH